MSDQGNYWTKVLTRRVTRRHALAAAGGGAAAAAFIAACGGDDDDEPSSSGSSSGSSGGSSGGSTGGSPAAGGPQQGGKLVWQGYGDIGGTVDLIGIIEYGTRQFSGLTHDGLLETKSGLPDVPGTSKELQPLLATAMPEVSPDKLSYTLKLKDAKFHDGTDVTAEDVKWSFETYATGATSAWPPLFFWLDSVEAMDAKTVTIKTKFPYADAMQGMAVQGLGAGDILSRAFQEGPDADKKLMGSGPFIFDSYSPPTLAKFKRNPDYHTQPYPFFDEVERTGDADVEKKIADIIGGNVQLSYWVDEAARDRIVEARSDLQMVTYNAAAARVTMRTDKAPWNDERVRRALSMSIDRDAIIEAVTQGEGTKDQFLSWTGEYWQFRHPEDLGENAKYWEYDPGEALKLAQATGLELPIKSTANHWNPTVIGPAFVDQFTLIKSNWKNAGIADIQSIEGTHTQINQGPFIGNYDDMFWFPNVVGGQAQIGLFLNLFLSFGGREPGPPTLNEGYVQDTELDSLIQAQTGEFDFDARVGIFRQMEDLLASKQYHVINITWTNNWFMDPKLKGFKPGQEAYNGAMPYIKYGSFDA